MIDTSVIFFLTACYALGCFNTAYYLTRYKLKEDIRDLGSSNAGAKNVGRVLGKSGFLLTFLVDFFKGALAVGAAYFFEYGELIAILALLAVVGGHILPIQLSFKGGKGLATSLAGLLIINSTLTLVLLAMTGASTYLTKNDHLSVSGVIVLSPIIAHWLGLSSFVVFGLVALSILILYSHRNDLKKTLLPKLT